MMNLRENLANPRGARSIGEYFQSLWSISDALALINSPITEEELVIHALNEIGGEYVGLAAWIRARETKISFEDLLDKATDYEAYLLK